MKVFAENRKARNSYEFLEIIEAGIVLTGSETKSIRSGGASLVDAFAIIEDEEIWIRELNIERYKYSNEEEYETRRARKLLLHKKEIKRLIGLTSVRGNSLVAIKLFEKNGFIKVNLALAKGIKNYDKRKKITSKQHKKEMKDYDVT
jgi:SsrA-binding protein